MDKQPRTPGRTAFILSVITENLWELVQLNLLFLLTCVPLVTIGPALTALDACFSDILQKQRRDEPILPRYFAAFRSRFLAALPWGLALLAGSFVLGFALFWYGSLASGSWLYVPFTALSLLGLIFFLGILSHLFLLLAEGGMEAGETSLPKAAALRALTRMKQTLIGLAAAFILLAVQFLLLPATVPLLLSLGLSVPGLIMAWACMGRRE
ncbi:hypothetical protein B5E77_00555 [Lachnoclostridium sp. An131]|uniref:DUF624 domain-containing protein n=1 Tax=Lachnoclostridium sp. An131 TaxID=1965555 RepID=UPI000B3975F6|nr:DUF624 domain-containing protein [Lachnoclostridium sp. An131]OUQ28892.1 hypothetical protein B5E77_00555 [Lachnoclostridium sp. An131]